MNEYARLFIDESLGAAGTCPVRAALVWARGLPGAPRRTEAPAHLAELVARVREMGEAFLPETRKAAVRAMLRHGAYKPSGRGKPSNEYLLAAAIAGDFPIVNAPADANNAASLEFGYPASVFDLDKTGPELLLKRGGSGDAYVFNASGQAIDLEDLLCVWRRAADGSWDPCGNPVKDRMDTKVFEDCRSVAAVVYAPAAEEGSRLEACAQRLADLFVRECGAAESGWSLAGL